MAIIREQYIGNAKVLTDDDCYAHLTPEQLEQRKSAVAESVIKICTEAMARKSRKNDDESA